MKNHSQTSESFVWAVVGVLLLLLGGYAFWEYQQRQKREVAAAMEAMNVSLDASDAAVWLKVFNVLEQGNVEGAKRLAATMAQQKLRSYQAYRGSPYVPHFVHSEVSRVEALPEYRKALELLERKEAEFSQEAIAPPPLTAPQP